MKSCDRLESLKVSASDTEDAMWWKTVKNQASELLCTVLQAGKGV